MKEAKDATCGTAGYTGDGYCDVCKIKVQTGTIIPATGKHIWSAGVVTKQPTISEKGEKTYTCTGCGVTKKEEMPILENSLEEPEEDTSTGKPSDEANPYEPEEDTSTEKPSDEGNPYEPEEDTSTEKPSGEEISSESKENTTSDESKTKPVEKVQNEELNLPEVNSVHTAEGGKATYKVTESGVTGGEVEYIAPAEGNTKVVVIPETITIGNKTYKITSIAEDAFANNKSITSVVISDNITELSANTFKGCTNLTSVNIGNGVTKVPDNMFKKLSNLTTVKLGKNIESIGKNAFRNCKKLQSITIQTKKLTAKKIGANAFKGVGSKSKKNFTIKVPGKKYVAKYKKLLQSKGLPKNVKVKK